MIDSKARKKIIKLWEQGNSKASIQRKMGVSQPTIRKVLQEAGLNGVNVTKESDTDLSDLGDRVELLEEQLEALMFTHTMKNLGQSDQPPQGAVTYTLYPIDTFIINTTRGWPSRGTPLFQALKNGVAFWRLDAVLGTIFNPNIIQIILDQIDNLGRYGIFQVHVEHKSLGKESVSVHLIKEDY